MLLIYKEKEDLKNAEEVGFEPTVPCRTSVFKTDAIGHSATLPMVKYFNRILPNISRINLLCNLLPSCRFFLDKMAKIYQIKFIYFDGYVCVTISRI